jgi:signal peptide peptidase SppA
MYNSFFNACWAIYPTALSAVTEAVKKAVTAGPVEDAQRYGLPIQKIGKTAIVSMKGPMLKEAGFWSLYGFAGSRDTANALKAAANDPDVESILWVVDSPGGSVDGLYELAETVKAVNAEKPITVQVDGMMASAAVYATAYADKIYAGPRDLVGSIGTRIMLYDYSQMFANAGIKAIPIDTGEHKSAGALGTEITEEQQAEFQRIADGYFDDFMAVLRDGRGFNDTELADGRVFFANEEPLTSGLIDGVRSLDEALATVAITAQSTRRTASAKLRLLEI